ncbi:sigma-54-dependent Fis family transcriptional regulator [Roseiconus nitratireducens]|uniref:DNA-binding transcriptional regulator NtrC n=1 Tax=Roseiconus nitratireducens TaxID=2605748 RepID=A0A5M6D7F4_9BACT|nr:sigma-54 dependent transcriptional regulator [Roseiconus nitratireducens]KAA5542586.1 sigma-54-dependent Fis family transcriptional regulator [Roseiconus nitratireducens]
MSMAVAEAPDTSPQPKSKWSVPAPNILAVDDDPTILAFVERSLASISDVATAKTAGEGLEKLRRGSFDAILLDIQLPDQNGLAAYCEIKEFDRRIPVIFMTVEAASGTAIEAMQLGAFDYIAKPLSVEPLRDLVEKAIEQRQISSVPVAISADDGDSHDSGELFIGRSPAMLDVFKAIGKVSKQDVPILIRGESGTGKELVARALYQYSHRRDHDFLAVNCAALPDNLLESELFGHEKGAFTGAESRRIGKFEQCNGGTLFLDEIGDMAPGVQAKVLRVLQEQRFERVGGNRELTTDVRIIAATNRPLEDMVAAGDYREDLLYRLNGVTIELPPLHQRLSDVPALIRFFLAQAKQEFSKPDLEGLSPEALDLLSSYHWPGNVRQLRAVIRRSVLDCTMPVITSDILPVEITRSQRGEESAVDGAAPRPGRSPLPGAGLPQLVKKLLNEKSNNVYALATEYMERYVITEVLKATEGNQSQAAEILGITRGKLRDRITSYHISLKSNVEIEPDN